MRFNCGIPLDERQALRSRKRKAYLSQWHPFFCLIPRRIGQSTCVWLEMIQRKGEYMDYGYNGSQWDWEYRLPYKIEVL